jgi:outer membrane lipoprotein-sorting protein
LKRIQSITILFLLCLVLVSACKPRTETPPGASTDGSATIPDSVTTAGGANAKDELTKAMKAVMDAKSYRSTLTTSKDGAVQSTTTVEFVAPDRFHMTQDLNTANKGQVRNEMAAVGGEVFMRPANGRWQKMPVDMSKMLAAVRDPKVIDDITKEADVKFLGTEQLNGQPMNVYQYTLKNALGSGVNSITKTWVSQTDHRPYKIETDQELNVNGKTEKSHTSSSYVDYDTDIRIQAPEMK